MANAVEDLKEEIKVLQGKLAKAAQHEEEMREKLEAATTGQHEPAAVPVAPGMVYIQRERKLPMFSGPPKESAGLEAEEWVLDMRAHLATRGDLAEVKKAGIVLDHLEGRPRREMRHREEECKTAEGIYKVVLNLFSRAGVGTTISGLKEKFFIRKQGHDESLLDYSHALLQLQSQVKARNPNRPLVDLELKETFASGLLDNQLRRDLLRVLDEDATISYVDLRDKAIKWSRGEVQQVKATSREEKVTPSDHLVEEITRKVRLELGMGDKQRKTAGPTKKRQFKCYKCGETGHFKRDCPKKKASQPAAAEDSPSQKAEN